MKLDWPKALEELEEATRELVSVRDELQELRREEAAAINRVNAAQKALDLHLATTRARCAQSGTDWARPALRKDEETPK
jgi:hypothetical protein